MTGKLAVVLFNMGGPDSPKAVQPFLFNLFKDPAILGAPALIRWPLAKFISSKRAPVAREIYAKIGGKSPLVELTVQQGEALASALKADGQAVRCFVAMRYWHPFTEQAVAEVKAWGADQVILLPLYPQYANATSASSLKEWHRVAKAQGLSLPTKSICCYPTLPGMIQAQADLLGKALQQAGEGARVLFSAHGLPKREIERGDPYQFHVEQSAKAIVAALGQDDLDWRVTYQSRVGPMEWLGPATDDEIRLAGQEGKKLVVLPIAFVSEHSETLVELDLEYGHLAKDSGVPAYIRVPALGTHPLFIEGLAGLVRQALGEVKPLCAGNCPATATRCPHAGACA